MTQVFLEALEGWLFELARQVPVLACLSSALLCPLNIRWTLDSCSFALSCEALFTLLAESVGPFDEVSCHFCATFTQKCAKTVPSPMKTVLHNLQTSPGQTKSDLERSALRATVRRTSLSSTFPDIIISITHLQEGERERERLSICKISLRRVYRLPMNDWENSLLQMAPVRSAAAR